LDNDHKDIFGIAFIQADLGKPISFERVDITKSINLTNEHKKTESVSTVIEVKNQYKTNLETYIVYQIKDEDGKVIHVDWSKALAPAENTFLIKHDCNIIKSGKYTVEIFVFNNLENPIPYSTKFTETIII